MADLQQAAEEVGRQRTGELECQAGGRVAVCAVKCSGGEASRYSRIEKDKKSEPQLNRKATVFIVILDPLRPARCSVLVVNSAGKLAGMQACRRASHLHTARQRNPG